MVAKKKKKKEKRKNKKKCTQPAEASLYALWHSI